MQFFFTADEHYWHENVIHFCNRPYANLEEMHESLIANHNSIIGKDDITVHIGDFCWKGKEQAQAIIKRLNGTQVFIKGSHDGWNKRIPYIWQRKIEDQYVICCHYAMRTWPRSHYGSWQIYGHSHGNLVNGINPVRQMDVGVDTNNYYPYSWEDIKRRLDNDKHNNATSSDKET